MAFAQRSLLRSSRPFIARSRLRSVRPDIISTLLRNDASASSKVPRICFGAIMSILSSSFNLALTVALALHPSTKSSGDVILGSLFRRIGKYLRSPSKFNQSPEIKEGGVIGATAGLLHVVRHDHDRVLRFELVDQLLDLCGRDRIERRTRLVH